MQYTVYKLVNCKGWDNERQPTKIYCFTKLHISQKYVSIKKGIFMFNIYDQKVNQQLGSSFSKDAGKLDWFLLLQKVVYILIWLH